MIHEKTTRKQLNGHVVHIENKIICSHIGCQISLVVQFLLNATIYSIKFMLGYVYLLDGSEISSKSAKQSIISYSIVALVFIVCYKASNNGILLRNFFTRLRIYSRR